MRRLLLALTVLAALVAAPSALAAEQRTTLAAAESIPRDRCDRGPLTGEPGVASHRFVPATGGLLTAALGGNRFSDWDLALFDSEGRLLGASSSFGAAEQALARVSAGREVTVQACRRFGADSSVPLSLDVFESPRDDGSNPAALVEVPIADEAAHERLEATGLDVTHDHTAPGPSGEPGSAKVVVYSPAERARLVTAGFAPTTVIPDMRAADVSNRNRELLATEVGIASALPSGRETYRQPQDYAAELKALAEDNPGLVRKVTLPLPSLEGRPIEGVEIATAVNRADDGRPVYIQMGIHHAREWPSGELPMEFALDLAEQFKAGNTRVADLLENTRTVILPIINPDGFAVSRGAGPLPAGADDNQFATLSLALNDQLAYKRKNCRPTVPGSEASPCAVRSNSGVDLNRNYGAYWGGPGSSSDVTAQGYRGPKPYSEPESEAVHQYTAGLHVTTLITNHTFTEDGKWLRQPGFEADFLEDEDEDGNPVTPDEAGMKDLGDLMGLATGWTSELGYETLGDITGATEDWNYFSQGTFGYTPEARGTNFHANYATSVVGEYGGIAGATGVGEAYLRAGEQAMDADDHSVISGTAGAGRILRLRKAFTTATSQALTIEDTLDTTLTVPASGSYEWHVNPSKRPLFADSDESWELTCEAADGTVLDSAQVDVARGGVAEQDLNCTAAPAGGAGGGSGGGGAGGSGSGSGGGGSGGGGSGGGGSGGSTGDGAGGDGAACDDPRGRRAGPRSLDRIRLGQRRRVAQGAYRRSELRRRSVERFCLTGRGSLRVGYPSSGLLRKLGRRERPRVRSRAVLVLSSSPAHRVRGVRAGSSRAALRRRFPGARRIRFGANVWHLARGRRARLVFKVRGRRVGEVGLADARLTSSRPGAARFLRSFR